jgi:hypothetical protein
MNDEMTPDPERPQHAPSDDPSVFGNLPSARPGVRSPRRDAGGRGSAQPKRTQSKGTKDRPARSAKPGRKPTPRPTPEAGPPPPRPPSTPPPGARSPGQSPPGEPESARGGVEEVAWAGITVAAEAATLGVRLVSRALEAVRERR